MLDIHAILKRLQVPVPLPSAWLGSECHGGGGAELMTRSAIDGSSAGTLTMAGAPLVDAAAAHARGAFHTWRQVPAPVRGELVRRFGNALRIYKTDLASLVSWEVGKIQQEALGEVQEMIDICDFAVGLSRQLYGLTMASERPLHRLTEQWHPLGPVGILSAFNFPVAVWAWNAALALVCGDSLVWKPSEKAPLCALACHALLQQTTQTMPEAPQALSNVIIGGREAGQALAQHPGLPLISATGSVPMGRSVAQAVGKRLGRSLLELGGNNAMIIAPSADLELAIRAAVFAAVGTAGQRCTSLRRLILHDSLYQGVVERLQRVYQALPVGDPRADTTLVGPLIDEAAAGAMNAALEQARALGARVHFGDRLREDVPPGGVYVRPALVEIEATAPLLQHEVFAPVLYLMRYHDFEQAIALNNGVPQGLASALFTNDMREAEAFCAATGSDCGIANVNIGTSGAEIGGAFGGEKDTGGGRESGSDAWKNYMRRATNTVNFSSALPLAQGIRFDS